MASKHQELMVRVEEAWEEIRNDQTYLQILTGSMPRRLQKLIDVGGANIHY